MEIASLATFNRANQKSQVDDGHYALLLPPYYLFPELVLPKMAHLVQMEHIERNIEDEGVVIRYSDFM